MDNKRGLEKDLSGKVPDTNNNLNFLKSIPAATLLAYAYLYFIGYLYLFFYFTVWGLNVNEMGFSIIDYATIAIYPTLRILIEDIAIFLFGLLAAYSVLVNGLHARKITLKNPLFWFLLIPVGLIIGGFIVGIPIMFIMFTYPVSFYAGLGIGVFRRIRKRWLYIAVIFVSITYFVLMLIVSASNGISNARIYRKYSYNFLSFPQELNEVILFSNKPLSGMEIYQTDPNKYEGLFLLAHKQDIYYLVPNIRRHDLFYEKNMALAEKVDILLRQVDELGKNTNQNIDAADVYIKKLSELNNQIAGLQEKAKGLSLDSPERAALLNAASRKTAEFAELLNKDKGFTGNAKNFNEQAKKKLDEASDTLKISKYLSTVQSLITRGTYAIKKDEISHLVYLYEGTAENKKRANRK